MKLFLTRSSPTSCHLTSQNSVFSSAPRSQTPSNTRTQFHPCRTTNRRFPSGPVMLPRSATARATLPVITASLRNSVCCWKLRLLVAVRGRVEWSGLDWSRAHPRVMTHGQYEVLLCAAPGQPINLDSKFEGGATYLGLRETTGQ